MNKCGCPRKKTGWLSKTIQIEHTRDCVNVTKERISNFIKKIKELTK